MPRQCGRAVINYGKQYPAYPSFMAGREKNKGSKVHTLVRAQNRGVAAEILIIVSNAVSFSACGRRTGN